MLWTKSFFTLRSVSSLYGKDNFTNHNRRGEALLNFTCPLSVVTRCGLSDLITSVAELQHAGPEKKCNSAEETNILAPRLKGKKARCLHTVKDLFWSGDLKPTEIREKSAKLNTWWNTEPSETTKEVFSCYDKVEQQKTSWETRERPSCMPI